MVCTGSMVRASPSCAMRATLAASGLVSSASVATTARVVLLPTPTSGGCSRSHSLVRTKPPPGSRGPATTAPLAGSTTSPAALTATSAPTVTPPASRTLAEPRPLLVARSKPGTLPTVAPVPAPTEPCVHRLPSTPPRRRPRRRPRPGARPAARRAGRRARPRGRSARAAGPPPPRGRAPPASASRRSRRPARTRCRRRCSTAWTRCTAFTGSSRSVSRVPGAEPRTSTPATAPSPSHSTTVQPVAASRSVQWPTARPATSVRRPVHRLGLPRRERLAGMLPSSGRRGTKDTRSHGGRRVGTRQARCCRSSSPSPARACSGTSSSASSCRSWSASSLAGAILGPAAAEPGALRRGPGRLAELGVIMLLFMAGLETHIEELARDARVAAVKVAVLGAALPFVGGARWSASSSAGARARRCSWRRRSPRPPSASPSGRCASWATHERRAVRIILAAAVLDDVLGLIVLVVVSGLPAASSTSSTSDCSSSRPSPTSASSASSAPASSSACASWLKDLHVSILFEIGVILTLALSLLADYIGLAAIVGAFIAGLTDERAAPAHRHREALRAAGLVLHAVLLRADGHLPRLRRVRQALGAARRRRVHRARRGDQVRSAASWGARKEGKQVGARGRRRHDAARRGGHRGRRLRPGGGRHRATTSTPPSWAWCWRRPSWRRSSSRRCSAATTASCETPGQSC